MNPIDIGKELHASAAMPSPHDARDYQMIEVARSAAPFDWSTGFDDEKLLGFKEPTKDQGQSGSCGGQAVSYLGGTFSVAQTKTFNEKSAKFIYAPIAYPNGGGTVGRDLVNRAVNAGWAPESLCVSYDNGKAPSEAFMARSSDITPAAIQEALKDKALSYVSVSADIESVAQALRDSDGIFIGVVGSNNGTWLSTHPKAPALNEPDCWGHWLKVGKARINSTSGKKEVAVHNSWGETGVGDAGWQWLDEDYFNTVLSRSSSRPGKAIFEAWAIKYNPTPAVSGFHHTFTEQLDIGQTSSEVLALQTALQSLGFFPATVQPTHYFGTITQAAVQKFQKQYGIASAGSPGTTGYGRVGPATLAQLNKLFA